MSSFAKKLKELKFRYSASEFRVLVPVVSFILFCGIVAISFSFCDKTNVVLRTLAPKDTIIYLETNDLGKTLNTLTESQSFKQGAASKLDFSVINDMQVAVVITGFETSENQVTDQQSILNFKPKFTAIAETHAWSWQVNSLVENNLDSFVKRTYGNDAKLEKKSVNNTERFIWTANDGRKTFAVISGSQVFFGNNEESLNKCLSAKRGETDNLLKNENLNDQYSNANGKLAFGYISNEGIRQIADFVGVSIAVGQSENANARGFISRVLPQILKNTTKEITWTAEKKEGKIEDKIYITTENEVSKVLSETLIPSSQNINELFEFLPIETTAVTRYKLKNPQIAFRSLMLVTAKNTDAVNGKIISAFSNSLLLQYGVDDAEGFLSAVESELITAKVDEDSSIAIVKVKDLEKAKASLIEELKFDEKISKEQDTEILKSEENSLLAAFYKDILILGDSDSVLKTIAISNKRKLSPIEAGKDFTKSQLFSELIKSKAVAVTFSKDSETPENIIKVLGSSNNKKVIMNSLTETRFNTHGIERTYISDYGFLGTIIEQFAN